MAEVLTEVEPEAICVECKLPFTFANSRAVKTRDSVLYCSPKCEAGLNIEGKRRALGRAVIEASLRLRRSTLALKKYFDDTDENQSGGAMEIYKLSGEDVAAREAVDTATDALIEFESSQQQIKK